MVMDENEKKKTKKKVKKIKSNKKNEDYNWNKKTIWGQLLILVGSTWL
jgi:preprotein translocase subunit Sec63